MFYVDKDLESDIAFKHFRDHDDRLIMVIIMMILVMI